eukprot:759988-Hanusia_phi.AAC.1
MEWAANFSPSCSPALLHTLPPDPPTSIIFATRQSAIPAHRLDIFRCDPSSPLTFLTSQFSECQGPSDPGPNLAALSVSRSGERPTPGRHWVGTYDLAAVIIPRLDKCGIIRWRCAGPRVHCQMTSDSGWWYEGRDQMGGGGVLNAGDEGDGAACDMR